MSKLLCIMFGHKTSGGSVMLTSIDNTGAHATVVATCDRCGDDYPFADLFLNSSTILDHLAKHRPDDLREALKRNEKALPPFDPRQKPTIPGGWI